MTSPAPWLTLVAVLCTAAVQGSSPGPGHDAVRNVFREMLHIQPPREDRGAPGDRRLPKHMVELYQQYSRQPPDTGAAATTIRNILPSLQPNYGVAGKEALVFNVSSVRDDEEEVRLAQLQLNRRRLPQRRHPSRRLLAPPYRVRLYQAAGGRLSPLASVPVSASPRGAWGALDITVPLRELLLDPRPNRRLLAVRFESPSGRPVPVAHFLRGPPDTPHAFLVVFTEDSEENQVAEDGGDPAPRPPIHSHALVQRLRQDRRGLSQLDEEQDNTPPIIPALNEYNRRRLNAWNVSTTKRILTSTTTGYSNIGHDENGNSQLPERRRETRSIMDNQLSDDEDIDEADVTRIFPETMLNSKNDLLRNPQNSARKPRRGKNGKRKKTKKQKYLLPPASWDNVYKEGAASGGGLCTVRKLTVNFDELGWGQWIISPDKFDANYCMGSCRFPLTKAVKPSNHATLQSLVHSLGHNPLVPAPACVPLHLSPITLLYFDETLNVVLKNYPSMIVDSCACR